MFFEIALTGCCCDFVQLRLARGTLRRKKEDGPYEDFFVLCIILNITHDIVKTKMRCFQKI